MVALLRKLSPRAEFLLVVLFAFGSAIFGNVLLVLFAASGVPLGGEPAITDESLRYTVVYEIVVLAVLGAFLWVRGWRPARLGRSFAGADLVAALGLAAGTQLMYYVVFAALTSQGPGLVEVAEGYDFARADVGVATLLTVSVVNPVFEEVLLCGYVVTVLKERRGFWTAVNVSLAIRLVCHFYQGSVGVISIVPLGFVFTYWYARTGRLWPLIIAHAAFDLVGLMPYLAP